MITKDSSEQWCRIFRRISPDVRFFDGLWQNWVENRIKSKDGIEKDRTGIFAECAKRVLTGPDGLHGQHGQTYFFESILSTLSTWSTKCRFAPKIRGNIKSRWNTPCSFKNREYFNLKICQAAGIFKIKEDKSFCHKPSKRQFFWNPCPLSSVSVRHCPFCEINCGICFANVTSKNLYSCRKFQAQKRYEFLLAQKREEKTCVFLCGMAPIISPVRLR